MKKLFTLLLVLFSLFLNTEIWAQDISAYSIDYGTSYGTFYNNGTTATTTAFASKWVSTATNPQLTIQVSNLGTNNMNSSNGYLFSKSDGKETYTLSVPDGYLITGYTLTGTASDHNSNGVTKIIFQANGRSAVEYANNASVSETITGVFSQTTTFTLEGKKSDDSNAFGKITSPTLSVNVMKLNKYITNLTKVTNVDDISEEKYYVIYQPRNDCYLKENGENLGLITDEATSYPLVNTKLPQYLLQFDKVDDTGTVHIKTILGRFIKTPSETGKFTLTSSTSERASTTLLYNEGYIFPKTGGYEWNRGSSALWGTTGSWSNAVNTTYNTGNVFLYELYEVDLTENKVVNVTYNLKFNGETIASQTKKHYVTDDVLDAETVFGTVPAYCTYGTPDVSSIAEETTEVNVTLNWDGPFTASTVESPVYYALKISTNDGSWWTPKDVTVNQATETRAHCVANTNILPAGNATEWAWVLIGNPYDGFKIYSVSREKYLGGRTAIDGHFTLGDLASANAFIVKNVSDNPQFYDKANKLYIDRSGGYAYAYSSGQKMTFQRLYNVKFALSDEDGGLQVGSDEVVDFDTEYMITTSASLSCTASGYVITAYDGFTTLAEALENDADGIINLTVKKQITFKLNYNGTVIASKTTVYPEVVDEPTTAAATIFGAAPDYCSYGTPDVATIESSTTEVNIDLNWTGPFEISTDYGSAIWYCMQIQGTKWLSTGTITDGVAPVTLSDLPTVTDSYLWAYVGNPVDGIKLINKGSGDGYYGAFDGSYYLNVQSGEENALLFSIEEGTNAFLLKKDDGKYMELLNDGKVGFYGTTPYGTYTNLNVRSYYCQQALFDLDQYAIISKVGKYFGVRQEGIDIVKGIVSDIPKLTKTQYDTYVPQLILDYARTVKYPGTGYYRIKNMLTTGEYGYIGVSGTASDEEIYLKGNISNVNDASTIILVTKDGSGKYTFQTQGKYIRNVRESEKAYLIDTAPKENFTMALGESAGYGVIRTWADGNYSYYHAASGNSYYLVGWEAAADASQWEFEDATSLDVALNSDGATTPTYYATLCLPFDVTISGATAYTLARSGNYLVPTEVGDNKVPAGTPVLLKSTTSSSATATINTGEAFNNGSPLDCVLTGTYLPKTIAGSTDYVLGKYNGKIGFYHWSSNNLGANRAYLAGTSDARGFELMFDDVVTGISSMDDGQRTMDDESIIYNLSGQRLNKMQKGINIVNGKKVLF